MNININETAIKLSNLNYHNLQLIRQSVIELDYVASNPLQGILLSRVGLPPFYFTNLIDIHGRNAIVLMCALFKGKTSLFEMFSFIESNFDQIDFKNKTVNNETIMKFIENGVNELQNLKEEYFDSLKKNRDKISAHQDMINLCSGGKIEDYVFGISEMKELLEKLEQVFVPMYYSLTNNQYELSDKSLLEEFIKRLEKDLER